MNNLHGILFAYHSDPHLRELTEERNTCSLPFGGRYRLVDFMLSNLVNAGVTDVGVIVHDSYQSLLDHLGSGKDWDLARKHGGLKILPPFGYANHGNGEYRGIMEALGSVTNYLRDIRQDYVMLAGADLVCNLPVQAIFAEHLKSGADITAVCTEAHNGSPRECDYFTAGPDGFVSDTAVHPAEAQGLESLKVYIMSKALLLTLTEYCASRDIPDFGRGVLLRMGRLKIRPYVFEGYVARIQTVGQYYRKSMDLLDRNVRRQLFDPERPVRTRDQSNPSTYYAPGSVCRNSLVADGCVIEGEVEDSILFRGVHVEKGARVKNCILMQGTVVGRSAETAYIIADKAVHIQSNHQLISHESYPLAIVKGATV